MENLLEVIFGFALGIEFWLLTFVITYQVSKLISNSNLRFHDQLTRSFKNAKYISFSKCNHDDWRQETGQDTNHR